MIERLLDRRRFAGDFDLTCCFRSSGLSYEDAETSMRTFAAEVVPALRTAET